LLSTFRISADSWSVAIGRRQYHEFRDFARKYARDPAYRLGRIDLAMATLMAYVNAQSRRLAYWWLLPKRAGPTGGSARAGQVGETRAERRAGGRQQMWAAAVCSNSRSQSRTEGTEKC
jgi:hypothetical protein